MSISNNKKLPFGKNKFYNIIKGKKKNGYFFVLPAISLSPTQNLSWDISLFSIFISWGTYFCQFNICEIIRDNNEDILKEDVMNIINMLKKNGLSVIDMPELLSYIKKNKYIISIAKNSNLSHPYIQNVMLSYFQYQPFIAEVNAEADKKSSLQSFT